MNISKELRRHLVFIILLKNNLITNSPAFIFDTWYKLQEIDNPESLLSEKQFFLFTEYVEKWIKK